MARDWDIFAEIVILLRATESFDEIIFSDMPDLSGKRASMKSIAVIMPDRGEEDEGFDDPDGPQRVRTVSWKLVVIARDKDPETRDRQAELLMNIGKDVINNTSIGGDTIAGRTFIFRDRYLPAIPPTRTLEANGSFAYFIDSDTGHATDA